MTRKALLLLCTLLLPFAGCAVHIPDASPFTDLQLPATPVAESQLLDVAIGQFTYELPVLDSGAPDMQTASIRMAEARYLPVMLRHTLMQTETWGAIHVMPQASAGHDLRVNGEILESESHTLRLRVRVADASGALWFERVYTGHAGAEAYGDNSIGVDDPFAGLYNRIANDMHKHAQTMLDDDARANLRHVAELQFGNEFAPQVYGDYLAADLKSGITSIARLPPVNDPAVLHLDQIRQRDRAFQEVLQQQYVDFARTLSDSYFEYRRQSYRELAQLRQDQRDARNDMLGGAVWLGIAMATSNIDDAVATIAATASATAGVVKLVRGAQAFPDESPFAGEIAESFSNGVVTEVVALDEDVVTLSGSTESIYAQWKEILRDLLAEDRKRPAIQTE